jgi:iron complex outermembrane receptor protein
MSFEATPTRSLDLRAAYTFTNSDERTPRVGQIRAFAIPDHVFSLTATERVGSRVLFNFDLAATSDYLAPVFDNRTFVSRAFRFGGQRRADVTASYTLPLSDSRSLRFFGKIENLFDREFYENGFRTPRITGRAGASLSF